MSETYRITSHAEGSAEFEVRADSQADAEHFAYQNHLTGISINGGQATWVIDTAEVVE